MNSDGFFSSAGQRAEVAWALHRAQQFVTSAGQEAFPRIAKGYTNSLIPTLEWENGFAAQGRPRAPAEMQTYSPYSVMVSRTQIHVASEMENWIPGPSSILL